MRLRNMRLFTVVVSGGATTPRCWTRLSPDADNSECQCATVGWGALIAGSSRWAPSVIPTTEVKLVPGHIELMSVQSS